MTEKCEKRRFVVNTNLFPFICDKKYYNLIKNVELWKWIRDWIKAMVSTVLSTCRSSERKDLNQQVALGTLL